MAGLIKLNEGKEGEIFLKWLHSRLIKNNKNVLGVNLGATGSGKSYRDLRMAELWYEYHFNEEFPTDHICFGVTPIMRLLSGGKLRRGDILIFEEAGVNLGSLDFQNKISKLFTYVLQSFRSMNIGIFFNLPYLSMMNKSARMLLHYSMESAGIDFTNNTNKCKPLFHQVNQSSGKIYRKYPWVKRDGRRIQIKRFNFSLPSPRVISAYESKKIQYLTDISIDFTKQLEEMEKEKLKRLERKILTDKQREVYELACKGLYQREIAHILGKSQPVVNRILQTVKKYGYIVEIDQNTKENTKNTNIAPLVQHIT